MPVNYGGIGISLDCSRAHYTLLQISRAVAQGKFPNSQGNDYLRPQNVSTFFRSFNGEI